MCPAIKLQNTVQQGCGSIPLTHNTSDAEQSFEKALGPLPFSLCWLLITNFLGFIEAQMTFSEKRLSRDLVDVKIFLSSILYRNVYLW